MKILLLSRYTRMGASSRLRTMQYLPILESEGFTVEIAPFFDDSYLQALYSGKAMRGSTWRYMVRRTRQIRVRPQPDLIWLEKEALPWIPWLLESAVLPRGIPIISDFDDAIFHRYDSHPSALIRRLLGEKIDRIMERSRLVTAGNSYLADRARSAGAYQVEIVPTVVDLTHYSVRDDASADRPVSVGWIGTPHTWSEYGRDFYNRIKETLSAHNARFRAIGAHLESTSHGLLDIVPWSEESEVDAVKSFDIGVMPLTDTPWTRGKCGYKLIQYMACGLPVVASPVGVNREIVEHGVNGFLAETDDEWRVAIEALLADESLRARMGALGRKKVEERYSLQMWGPRLAKILKSIVREGKGS